MWQTPNVPNGGRVNPPDMSPTGKMPDGKKRQVGLEHQVKMVEKNLWPTPRATDADHGGPNQRDSKGKYALPGAVHHMWPTPQSFDAKEFVKSPEAMERNKKKGGCRNLREEVQGQLNPDWVECLVGLPIGWTAIDGPPARESHSTTGNRRESPGE